MAIMTLGSAATISQLDEGSTESIPCRAHFAQVRDTILRAFPWNWARRRVALTNLGNPPSNWGFSYAYPTDCLQALSLVLPGARIPRRDLAPPFEIGNDGTRRVIYTDLAQAELVYTGRVENVALWDPLAQEALVNLLASKIAMPLAVKPDLAQGAMNAYRVAMTMAAAQSLNEGHDLEPESEFLTARR